MKYVALLRGIAPMNPNMRNDKLRGVLEDLGFKNVRTVISSGNVLFESALTDTKSIEAKIEAAWPERLGFNSTTIIRSQAQLQKLIKLDPFAGLTHSKTTSLNVTFCKNKTKSEHTLPHQPQDRDYKILAIHGQEVFSVIDLTSAKTPDLMVWLEREFGKQITTRTWLTVGRILNKFKS